MTSIIDDDNGNDLEITINYPKIYHGYPSYVENPITKISKMIGAETQIPMFKVEKVHTIPQQITILLNKMTEDNYKEWLKQNVNVKAIIQN